jgi:hypothetical protein
MESRSVRIQGQKLVKHITDAWQEVRILKLFLKKFNLLYLKMWKTVLMIEKNNFKCLNNRQRLRKK